jgi:hypothetical protein
MIGTARTATFTRPYRSHKESRDRTLNEAQAQGGGMTEIVYESNIEGLQLAFRGKVRDVYDLDDALLIVTSDRLSAFDVVLPTPIPEKGRVLSSLSRFWFEHTTHIVRNHLLDRRLEDVVPAAWVERLRGRSQIVRKAKPLPVEAVVRGYLVGSGWERVQAPGLSVRRAPPGGPAASRQAAGAAVHPVQQGADGPARREHHVRSGGASARRRHRGTVCATCRWRSTGSARNGRGARDHHRGHQVRVRHLRGRAHSHRRGHDTRLLALLAAGPVSPRHLAAELRQSNTCATI